MSGLPPLNLLDALSPIIAERAQGRGADVTWSAGLAGKIMWDNCWIASGESETEEGEDRRTRLGGHSAGGMLGFFFFSTAVGGD